MKRIFNENKAITLVALVITIIGLLILAGISIQAMTNTGIFTQAENAKRDSEIANIKEKIVLDIYEKQLEPPLGSITEEQLETILGKYGTVNKEENGTIIGITTEEGYEILLSEIYSGGTTEEEKTLLADGSWNSAKQVNSPKLMEGMTGIYWELDSTTGKEIEVEVNEENQDNWYDYANQKWANAITKDSNGNTTGYWVWIPRYAYQITSNCNTSTAGTIAVKFLQGTTNRDKDGTEISKTYPTVTNNAMTDYVVHPCFTDGTKTATEIANGAIPFGNGEWDSEIQGFWGAKYPAGFQANTITQNNNGTLSTKISNSSDTVVYSDKNYTSYYGSITTNALGQNLTSSGYSSSKLSYPVFNPLTYAYNNISTGDAYTISQEIKNASSFYGLNTNKTDSDSHLMKNIEWGAVAYLTQSSYGRNGTEVNLNNYYTTESSPWRTAITGMCINGTSGDKTTTLGSAYNTATGVKGSSTANITGVYDLNGCVWEYITAYITNGNTNLSTFGSSYVAKTTADINGYKTLSTKYATVYPYNSSDSRTNNYNTYKGLKSTTYGYGDAILETSNFGNGTNTSWNGDLGGYTGETHTFFLRGGSYEDSNTAGMYATGYDRGCQWYHIGFRAVLVGI